MPAYRIRLLDSGGTKIANQIRARSDDYQAMSFARSLIAGGGLAYIWDGPCLPKKGRDVGKVDLY